MSSNIQITKKCQWCGKEFIARTTTTAYCSHRCSSLAYKERARQKRVENAKTEYAKIKSGEADLNGLEFLTPRQAGTLLGIGWRTVYNYINQGVIKVWQLKRKTLIRRSDLEALFGEGRRTTQVKSPDPTITEWYTTKEVMEKFKVGNAWVFKVGKEQNIPKVLKFAKTYWSKKHFDAYFAKKAASPEITSWYTAEEIKEKFSMTDSAVWNFASKNAIPKKKEGGKTFYSKRHVDQAKGLPVEDEREYYTYKEAMAKYGLTHDQVCHYLKTYKIYKIKVGKITKFDRQQFDDLMAPPMV